MEPVEIADRFRLHPQVESGRQLMEELCAKCCDLAQWFNMVVPDSREKALALTSLEQAMVWANLGLVRVGAFGAPDAEVEPPPV